MFRFIINLIFKKDKITLKGKEYTKVDIPMDDSDLILYVPNGLTFSYGSKKYIRYPLIVKTIKQSDVTVITK